MRPGPDVALAACRLSKAFGDGSNQLCVLNEVTFALRPGQLNFCVGPSGSGKSTLVSVLGGLLAPDRGRVTLLGHDLWSLTPKQRELCRLQHCGFVFQGCNLFPALTALEQVLLVLRYCGVNGGEAQRRALAALDEVGLAPQAHLRPAELSGGEKQRVAIARAVVKQPGIILADEPTSALDGHTGELVVDLLHRHARRHGATILCVTHDPRLLRQADRVIHLEDGVITETSSPAIAPAAN
jgi:putative ABC transport system ATP-binding protein